MINFCKNLCLYYHLINLEFTYIVIKTISELPQSILNLKMKNISYQVTPNYS